MRILQRLTNAGEDPWTHCNAHRLHLRFDPELLGILCSFLEILDSQLRALLSTSLRATILRCTIFVVAT